jgi:hypothetical protein
VEIWYGWWTGDYKVIYRSANANQTVFSIERDITVKSGQSVTIDL